MPPYNKHASERFVPGTIQCKLQFLTFSLCHFLDGLATPACRNSSDLSQVNSVMVLLPDRELR